MSRQPTSILEVGFGLGLNFLLTADLALSQSCPLSYVAFEHDLIGSDCFLELEYAQHLNHTQLCDSLVTVFESSEQLGSHTTQLSDNCQLTLHRTDITGADFMAKLHTNLNTEGQTCLFDAIYLDAFSPETNPECWTLPLFQQLRACIKPEGVLTTYSVKGSVRRALTAAGFSIEKLPGPPGKREILRALAVKES